MMIRVFAANWLTIFSFHNKLLFSWRINAAFIFSVLYFIALCRFVIWTVVVARFYGLFVRNFAGSASG